MLKIFKSKSVEPIIYVLLIIMTFFWISYDYLTNDYINLGIQFIFGLIPVVSLVKYKNDLT